jgi:hypothetical protein
MLEKAAVEQLNIKSNHWMFKVTPDRRFPTPAEMKDHKLGYMNTYVVPGQIAKEFD